MKPKMLAILLLAGDMAFTTGAQAQGWGSGMYGMSPPCPYQNGMASGANAEDDRISGLLNDKRDLQKEEREAKRLLKELEDKKEKYTTSINDSLQSAWADKVTDHLENGYNCNCAPPAAPPTVLSYEVLNPPREDAPPTYVAPPAPAPEPEPIVEPVLPQPQPRPARPNTDIFDPNHQSRSPASINDPSVAPPAATSVVGNQFDAGWTGSNSMSGDGEALSMCGPDDEISHSKPWKAMCRNGGGVAKEICRIPFFLQSGAREKQADCSDAIQNYRKVTKEVDRLRNSVKSYADRIKEINLAIGDMKKDQAELEASCPTGDCYRPRAHAESSTGNLLSSLMPLGLGILGSLGGNNGGYRPPYWNPNNRFNRFGFPPPMPYQARGFGYPFAQAGGYGALPGGQMGGFGCSGGLGGGGFGNGPAGMLNPYAAMSPLGFPNGGLGGGMFNPGVGPWGAAGIPGGIPRFGPPGVGVGVPRLGGLPGAMPSLGVPGGIGGTMIPGGARVPSLGVPGIANGGLLPGAMQSPLLNQPQLFQTQALQAQALQAQAVNNEVAQIRTDETLMQEYYALMYQMNQVNGGANGLGGVASGYTSPLLGYGNYTAPYGLGINYGLAPATEIIEYTVPPRPRF